MPPEDKIMKWLASDLLDSEVTVQNFIQAIHYATADIVNLTTTDHIRTFSVLPSGPIIYSYYGLIGENPVPVSAGSNVLTKHMSQTLLPRKMRRGEGTGVVIDVAAVTIGSQDFFIVKDTSNVTVWTTKDGYHQSTAHSPIPSPVSTLCTLGESLIATFGVYPTKSGHHELILIYLTPNTWYITRKLRMELHLKEVFDICSAIRSGAWSIILCSIRDRIIASVNLDGQMQWKISDQDVPFPLEDAHSICADNKGGLYVASSHMDTIFKLSSDDGSVLAQVNFDNTLFIPICIRYFENMLFVAHADREVFGNGGIDAKYKWMISSYNI